MSTEQKKKEEEQSPACVACRKRKRRCSRGRPCENCIKSGVNCIYVDETVTKKTKLSMAQRMTLVEEVLKRQAEVLKEVYPAYEGVEFNHETEDSPPPITITDVPRSPKRLKREEDHVVVVAVGGDGSDGTSATVLEAVVSRNLRDTDDFLPPNDLLYSLIDLYFERIHPWIPILHRRILEDKMKIPAARRTLSNILHAIVAATARFSSDARLSSAKVREGLEKLCRERVLLRSMEAYSLENLQAQVIIAFDLIGAGKGPKSWSIVDSMCQMIQHLELAQEHGESERTECKKLLHRVSFLKPPQTWLEEEERRRTFWCVFFLDRFCSVSAGWAPIIPTATIIRKLPCGGTFYYKERQVNTRYFNTDHSQFDPASEVVASLGGLAYCIEATESLSQVALFYLEHEIDINNLQGLQLWLQKFRDLDARLIRWRESLPPQWRQVIPRTVNHVSGTPLLDENLTLAHVTHNASVILLHQYLAYPIFVQWQVQMTKSQTASANTCVSAAREIRNMTAKFLSINGTGTNSQFSFCVFVACRALLAHAAFYHVPVNPEFHEMIKSLKEMSARWRGSSTDEENLPLKFANGLLEHLSTRESLNNPAVDIRKSVYNAEVNVEKAAQPNIKVGTNPSPETHTLEEVDIAQYPRLFQTVDFRALYETSPQEVVMSRGIMKQDMAAEISYMFEDPKFIESERVWDVGAQM